MFEHLDSAPAGPPLAEAVRDALKPRAALAALALAAVALAVVMVSHESVGVATVRIAGVAVPVAFGLYRLTREPADRFALLLLAAGAMWSLTTLAESSNPTLYSAGRVSVWLVEPVIVFLILAFPRGRLETALERRLVAAVGIVVATLYVPAAFLAPFPEAAPWTSCGTHCPANAFQLTSGSTPLVDNVMRPGREVLSIILFAAVAFVVARRAQDNGAILRRILAPVAAVALVRTVTLVVYFAERRAAHSSPLADALGWIYVLSLPTITLAFAGGLLAHRLFVAGALERLTQTLSSRPNARELRETLDLALRDTTLRICFYVPESPGGWVDETGWPVARPVAGPTSAVTEITSEQRVVAAIVHDHQLAQDRALLAGVCSYVLASLENRQLVGELRSSLEELTASRARLVTVADEERRKIERDLHDGAQQRLVALQIKLALLAEQLEPDSAGGAERVRALEPEIEETLAVVRRFGHGLYPPLLADRGLGDALNAIARTAPVPTTVDAQLPHRYPREVESAVYFACLEALQNVTKHARGATSVTIALSGNGNLRFDVRDNGAGFNAATTQGGAGLTHMRDRVGAVGGDVVVTSDPGKGTRVSGIVPVP